MQTLRKYDRCVLETGGSIVTDPNLLNTLLTTCFVAWLHAEPEEYMRRLIEQGDVRPMENQEDAMSDLRRIISERVDLWDMAHVSVDTNRKSVDACVSELMQLLPEGLKENMRVEREA